MSERLYSVHRLADHLLSLGASSELAALASAMFVPMSYAKGDLLLRAAEVGRHLWFIERGLIKHYTVSAEGRQMITCFFSEGSFWASPPRA